MPPIARTLALGAALGVGATLWLQPEPEPPEPEVHGYHILHELVRQREILRKERSAYEPGTTRYDRLEAREALLTRLLNRLVDSRQARARLGLELDDGQSDDGQSE